MSNEQDISVAVVGAGSIGCFVGGLLASRGVNVTFCGRERVGVDLAQNGLTTELIDGTKHSLEGSDIQYVTDIADLPAADTVLVCVKSDDTVEVGQKLAQSVNAQSTIISLQNGLDNADMLLEHLPDAEIIPGMVAFNVVWNSPGHYVCATDGDIFLGQGNYTPALCEYIRLSGVPCQVRKDMDAVQYAKLMLNLNNALNVLSGLPLLEQLRNRRWRKIMADCIDEGLAVAKSMGLQPARIGKVKTAFIPFILRLPDFLFERIAAQMLKIDPAARTSMCDDLEKGRRPEIDHLNGKVVALGQQYGVPTPANEKVVTAIGELFAGNRKAGGNPAELI